jgi:hypothetical protein
MTRIKCAVPAVVMLCVCSTTMLVTGATAHTFSSNLMASLKGSADATQVFKTTAGNVECTKVAVASGLTVLTLKTIKAIVNYTGCTAFGLSATVSPADYVFDADGTASMMKEVTIKATGCEVKVPIAGNLNLHTVKYKNNGTGVLLEPNVVGITSSGTGAACTYASESKGTYAGNSHLSAGSGDTQEWF